MSSTDQFALFADKVVLVTGAGRGIGRAVACHFARLGARVVINDIDLASARRIGEPIDHDTPVAEIQAAGGQAIGVEADVTVEEDVDRLFADAIAAFGQVDIVINNVGGTLGGGAIGSCEKAAWDRDIALNLTSVFLCGRAAIRHMTPRKTGRIINISSVSGFRPMTPSLAPYSAGKAALHAVTRSMALEVAPLGITVNAVAFGNVDTALFRANVGAIADKMRAQVPLGRLGTVDDCNGVIQFLASAQASYMTGQVLVVDGGWIDLNPNYVGGEWAAR